PTVGADGPAEGPRRTRTELLHQPRLAQGPGPAGPSAGGPLPPLAAAVPADPGRRLVHPGRPSGDRGVLRDASAREPAERLGVPPERADRRPGRARGARARRRAALRRRRRGARAALLGRLPGGPRRGGALAGTSRPDPRSVRLPTGRR